MPNTWIFGALEQEPIQREGGFLIPFTIVIEKGVPVAAYHCLPSDRKDVANSLTLRRLFDQNPTTLGKGLGVRDEKVEFVNTKNPVEINRVATSFVERVAHVGRGNESNTTQLVVEFLTPRHTLNLLIRGESDNAPLSLIASQQELEEAQSSRHARSVSGGNSKNIRSVNKVPPPMRNGILQPFPLAPAVASLHNEGRDTFCCWAHIDRSSVVGLSVESQGERRDLSIISKNSRSVSLSTSSPKVSPLRGAVYDSSLRVNFTPTISFNDSNLNLGSALLSTPRQHTDHRGGERCEESREALPLRIKTPVRTSNDLRGSTMSSSSSPQKRLEFGRGSYEVDEGNDAEAPLRHEAGGRALTSSKASKKHDATMLEDKNIKRQSTAVMFWWRAERPTTAVYPAPGSYEEGVASWGYVAKRNVNSVTDYKLYPYQRGVTVDADGQHGLSARIELTHDEEQRVYKAAEFLIRKLSGKAGGRPVIEAKFVFRFVPRSGGGTDGDRDHTHHMAASDLYFYYSPLLRRVADLLDAKVRFLIPRQFQKGASFTVKNKGNHVGEEDLVRTPRLDAALSVPRARKRGGREIGHNKSGEGLGANDSSPASSPSKTPIRMRYLDEKGMTALQRQQEKRKREEAAKLVPKFSPCPDAPREHPVTDASKRLMIKKNSDKAYARALIEALDGNKTIPIKTLGERLGLSKKHMKYLEALRAERATAGGAENIVEMRAFSLEFQKEKGALPDINAKGRKPRMLLLEKDASTPTRSIHGLTTAQSEEEVSRNREFSGTNREEGALKGKKARRHEDSDVRETRRLLAPIQRMAANARPTFSYYDTPAYSKRGGSPLGGLSSTTISATCSGASLPILTSSSAPAVGMGANARNRLVRRGGGDSRDNNVNNVKLRIDNQSKAVGTQTSQRHLGKDSSEVLHRTASRDTQSKNNITATTRPSHSGHEAESPNSKMNGKAPLLEDKATTSIAIGMLTTDVASSSTMLHRGSEGYEKEKETRAVGKEKKDDVTDKGYSSAANEDHQHTKVLLEAGEAFLTLTPQEQATIIRSHISSARRSLSRRLAFSPTTSQSGVSEGSLLAAPSGLTAGWETSALSGHSDVSGAAAASSFRSAPLEEPPSHMCLSHLFDEYPTPSWWLGAVMVLTLRDRGVLSSTKSTAPLPKGAYHGVPSDTADSLTTLKMANEFAEARWRQVAAAVAAAADILETLMYAVRSRALAQPISAVHRARGQDGSRGEFPMCLSFWEMKGSLPLVSNRNVSHSGAGGIAGVVEYSPSSYEEKKAKGTGGVVSLSRRLTRSHSPTAGARGGGKGQAAVAATAGGNSIPTLDDLLDFVKSMESSFSNNRETEETLLKKTSVGIEGSSGGDDEGSSCLRCGGVDRPCRFFTPRGANSENLPIFSILSPCGGDLSLSFPPLLNSSSASLPSASKTAIRDVGGVGSLTRSTSTVGRQVVSLFPLLVSFIASLKGLVGGVIFCRSVDKDHEEEGNSSLYSKGPRTSASSMSSSRNSWATEVRRAYNTCCVVDSYKQLQLRNSSDYAAGHNITATDESNKKKSSDLTEHTKRDRLCCLSPPPLRKRPFKKETSDLPSSAIPLT